MKNRFFSVLVLFIALTFSLIANAQGGYTIKGTISGGEGASVYLHKGMSIVLMPQNIIDSTRIRDGRFEFGGTLSPAELLTVSIRPATQQGGGRVFSKVIPVFVDGGTISIEGALEEIPRESFDASGTYDFTKVKVSGNETTTLFKRYMDEKLALHRTRNYQAYNTYLRTRPKPPVSVGIDAVTAIDAAKDQQTTFSKRFIQEHRDHVISWFVLEDNLSSFTLAELNQLESTLPRQYADSEYGRKILGELARVKTSAVGAKFHDLMLQDNEGKPFKLSDHLGKGKYVLLEFWASWCGPCRADIPHLKEVHALYNAAGFEIIGVSMDEDKAKWLQAIEEEKLYDWPQVSDLQAFQGNIHKLYNFQGIPACVLIDPNGIIVDRNMRGSWMDKKLVELYGNRFGDKY